MQVKLKSDRSQKSVTIYCSPGFKSFWINPRIIGRLPILTYLDPARQGCITQNTYRTQNAITKQYEKLFEMDGIKLRWDDNVLEYIVR